MHAKRVKDIKAREIFAKNEMLKKAQKFVFTNTLNKLLYEKKYDEYAKACQYFAMQKVENDSKTKIVNRCVATNRSRGAIRPFGINRVMLKDMLEQGLVPGWKKASW